MTGKELSTPNIGYLSLALCLVTTMTVDEAFEKIAPDSELNRGMQHHLENEDIYSLRENFNLTWAEIGEIFNITASNACHRATRFRDKILPDQNRVPTWYYICGECGQIVNRNHRLKHIQSGHKMGVRRKPLVSFLMKEGCL